jgi:energy-coupling factor transporter ATP-binding protein EcfA2
MNNQELQYLIPVEHLSYSALKSYCANRAIFKKIYIMKQGDFKKSENMVIGTMGHKAAELFYQGLEWEECVQAGIDLLDSIPNSDFYNPEKVNRESMLKTYAQAMQFFSEEKPEIGKVLATELDVTTDFLINGQPAPLPIKAKTDLLSEMPNGDLHIWDYKFTKLFREFDQEQPDFILQSIFNYITVSQNQGKAPKVMHYVQVKTSKNRDNSPQILIYDIEFDKHPEYFTYFERMYSGFIYEIISPNVQFLPNFGDFLNGKEAWEDFTQDLVDFDLPKVIDHQSVAQRNKGKIRDDVDFIESKANIATSTDHEKIVSKLLEFGISLKYKSEHRGANVTLLTFVPSRGVAMNKIKAHEADLELALGAKSIVVHAPLKGTQLVGIEVSNKSQRVLEFDDKLLSITDNGSLLIPIGQDVYGELVKFDLSKAPHMLVAGATGSGKSVFLNVVLEALTRQNKQGQLGLYLIDPKGNEFFNYEDNELIVDYVSTTPRISEVFLDLVETMESRYSTFKQAKVRDIKEYNAKTKKQMPYIVVVVDELSDLMLTNEVLEKDEPTGEYYKNGEEKMKTIRIRYADIIENHLVRLAQKSRAAGIHLICATQRPSTDVVKGILKANLPTRIGFMTATSVDSNVILDEPGTEKLIGNGDLLFKNPNEQHLYRLQGFYK